MTVDEIYSQMAETFQTETGLALAGDVVTQVVCMTKPEDEYFNWHIVWFPVAPP